MSTEARKEIIWLVNGRNNQPLLVHLVNKNFTPKDVNFNNLLCAVWAFQVAQWEKIHLPMQEIQEMQVRSLGQEDPLQKEIATHSTISCGASEATV